MSEKEIGFPLLDLFTPGILLTLHARKLPRGKHVKHWGLRRILSCLRWSLPLRQVLDSILLFYSVPSWGRTPQTPFFPLSGVCFPSNKTLKETLINELLNLQFLLLDSALISMGFFK